MPTITTTDINQDNNNRKKINDSHFCKKLEEFLRVEKNVKSVKELFNNFFNQTNSK